MNSPNATDDIAEEDVSQRGVTRYVALSSLFRRRIEVGLWAVNERIPTVEELAKEVGAAKETVRQALSILEEEGLIRRFRAKGTFVTGTPADRLWCQLHTDYFGVMRAREGVKVELLSEEGDVTIPGTPEYGHPADAYRHLVRRHWREETPYLYSDLFIAENVAEKIPHEEFSTETALQLVSGRKDINVGAVEQIMTIGLSDLETSKALKIPLNAAVANVNRYVLDDDGRLILFTRGVYRGDIVRLKIRLK